MAYYHGFNLKFVLVCTLTVPSFHRGRPTPATNAFLPVFNMTFHSRSQPTGPTRSLMRRSTRSPFRKTLTRSLINAPTFSLRCLSSGTLHSRQQSRARFRCASIIPILPFFERVLRTSTPRSTSARLNDVFHVACCWRYWLATV